MNLAIVISVGSYRHPLSGLPGCRKDGEMITALLEAGTMVDDKLIMIDVASSAEIKKQLSEFISKYKGSEPDKVFFYFSGHGDFIQDEFFYLLPDYQEAQRRQTSLENSEIDNLLRGLRPNLAVKVIDACHSGIPYIKDKDAFTTYLKGTKEEFQKCYFMFSSQVNQASYQSNEASFFTRRFVEAIAKHPTDSIRFKDIIDYISDSFAGDVSQTPFFVLQADYTEIFCEVTDGLREKLGGLLKGEKGALEQQVREDKKSLKKLVEEDASRYCTEEESSAILEKLGDQIGTICINHEGKDLYDVRCEKVQDYSGVPMIEKIGQWVDQNKPELFVKVIDKYEIVDVPTTDAFSVLFGKVDQAVKIVKKKNRIIVGIGSTVPMPYSYIMVSAKPKYPNIDETVCYVVPLLSETEVRFFTAFGTYEKKMRRLKKEINWETSALGLKDDKRLTQYMLEVFTRFWDYTLAPIIKRFGLLGEEQTESSDGGEGKESG